MSETFETYCKEYFNRLAGGNNIQTNQETARERDKNILSSKKSRSFIVVGKNIKSEGPDVISGSALDEAMVRAFQGIPLPQGRELAVEYHFLMHANQGIYTPSKFFEMPDNGGAVNYSCQLGHTVDWSSVVAAGHPHPLYKDKPTGTITRTPTLRNGRVAKTHRKSTGLKHDLTYRKNRAEF